MGAIFHEGEEFGGALSIDTLMDVDGDITPADGDILVYNAAKGLYEPSGNLSSLNSAMVKKDTNYNLGTAVDLSSYTGTVTKYTIPKDGYLNIQFATGTGVLAYASCWIEGNNESVHVYLQAYANNNKGANAQGELVSVKKGFKISNFSCDNSAANAKLYFIPFDAV